MFLLVSIVLLFVIYNTLTRLWLKDIEDIRAFTMVYNIFASAMSFSIYLFLSITGVTDSSTTTFDLRFLVVVIVTLILWGIFERIRFNIPATIEVSVGSILGTISTALIFIAGILIFKDNPTYWQVIGFILILFSNVLFIQKINLSSLNKQGLNAIFITNAIVVITAITEKYISSNIDIWFYTTLVWCVDLFVIYFFPRISKQAMFDVTKQVSLSKILFLALLNVIVYDLYILSLQRYSLSLVNTFMATITGFSVFSGYVFLKETDHRNIKFISAFLATIGIALVGFVSTQK